MLIFQVFHRGYLTEEVLERDRGERVEIRHRHGEGAVEQGRHYEAQQARKVEEFIFHVERDDLVEFRDVSKRQGVAVRVVGEDYHSDHPGEGVQDEDYRDVGQHSPGTYAYYIFFFSLKYELYTFGLNSLFSLLDLNSKVCRSLDTRTTR